MKKLFLAFAVLACVGLMSCNPGNKPSVEAEIEDPDVEAVDEVDDSTAVVVDEPLPSDTITVE